MIQFLQRYLPNWCREAMLWENAALKNKVQALQEEVGQLNAYINGLERACRLMHKVVTIKGVDHD